LARLAGGAQAVAKEAETFLISGDPEKALHMIEVAVAAAPDDEVVRRTEARIIVQLINQTQGVGFDEIGWLESKLRDALEKVPDKEPG
jgi:alkyl sulfatase BDS1-like metallo-beta-lactamase superfamily hydrolase